MTFCCVQELWKKPTHHADEYTTWFAVAINVTDWCNLHKNIHDIDMIMWQKTHVLHLPTSNATSFRLHWMVSNHDSTRRDVIRIVFFCEHIGATNPWPRSCGNRETASKCERAASKSLTDAHWDCGAGNNVTDYHTHACWCMWDTIFARLVQTIHNACCNHLHNHCLKCTARGQNRNAIWITVYNCTNITWRLAQCQNCAVCFQTGRETAACQNCSLPHNS